MAIYMIYPKGTKRPKAHTGAVELVVRQDNGTITKHVFDTQKLAAMAFGVQSNTLSDVWRRGTPVQTKLGLVYAVRRVV